MASKASFPTSGHVQTRPGSRSSAMQWYAVEPAARRGQPMRTVTAKSPSG
ncbi:MAG: hypothetical protein IPJ98_04445 [Bryobacterales bacterium]|nr:hypothetical protein [Bryobacterales bacterium]